MTPPAKLTALGRRVLAHLPDWAEDEAAFVEMEGGPEVSIRSYDLPTFTARLAEDIHTRIDDPPRPLTEDECKTMLDGLVTAKLASHRGGQWRMTKHGRESLIAPEGKEDQVLGPVVLDLAPAQATTDAQATPTAGG
jgi:hypothetical protein